MTSEDQPGAPRSWAPETPADTGWPGSPPASSRQGPPQEPADDGPAEQDGEPGEPSWAQPAWSHEEADESEYDAWLEAQEPADVQADEPADEAGDEPAQVEAPVVVPDAVEAAATPLEVTEVVRSPETAPEAAVEAAPEASGEPARPAGETTDAPLEGDAVVAAVPAHRSATPVLVPLVVLVVLLAAAAAVLGVQSVRTRGGGGVEDARRDALQAARDAARVVFSYDYRHLDKDFAAGRAVTTGSFAGDYQRTTSRLVDDVAAKYKAVVVADVSDAGVVTASRSRVVVLLFVNQQSTSSLTTGTKITTNRLTMTMVRSGGRWKVSQVRAF